MPKIISRILLVLILLAMFPPLLIALKRARKSDLPQIHLIQDMDNQSKLRAQHTFDFFADERAMRKHPDGTVARGSVQMDDHFYRGLVDGRWATEFPEAVPFDEPTLRRGEERFNIYCAPCHGTSGDGMGMISVRAAELLEQGSASTWVQPKAVFDPLTMQRPIGELFHIVTHGINTMAGYESQIPEHDRWAIVAWVKVLQRSQVADWSEVPADKVSTLREQQRGDREAAAIRAAEEAEAARKLKEQQEAAEREAAAADGESNSNNQNDDDEGDS